MSLKILLICWLIAGLISACIEIHKQQKEIKNYIFQIEKMQEICNRDYKRLNDRTEKVIDDILNRYDLIKK